MPKRKPDQVVRIEFALNRTDREVIERYLLFEKADKASETVSQIIGALTSTDGGLLASWFLLDIIDDWAVPDDEFWRVLLPGNSPTIGQLLWRALTALGRYGKVVEHEGPWDERGPVEAAQEREGVTWATATKEQRRELWPMRQKVNDIAKAGKWLIAGYFTAKWGDDWLNAIGGLLPSSGGIPPIVP